MSKVVADEDAPEAPPLVLPEGFKEELYKTIAELFAVPPDLLGEPVHIPWYRRLRYRLGDAREAFAGWVYELLAGHNLPESDW